jgi:hypothetical protein
MSLLINLFAYTKEHSFNQAADYSLSYIHTYNVLFIMQRNPQFILQVDLVGLDYHLEGYTMSRLREEFMHRSLLLKELRSKKFPHMIGNIYYLD